MLRRTSACRGCRGLEALGQRAEARRWRWVSTLALVWLSPIDLRHHSNVLKNRQSALKEGADATGPSGTTEHATKRRNLMENYRKKWKVCTMDTYLWRKKGKLEVTQRYVNEGLAQPEEGDIAKFEKLRIPTLSSSPEQVIGEWERTPEKESGCVSWKSVQQILQRTGEIREWERGKERGV